MRKHSIAQLCVASFVGMLLGCTTGNSTPVSVDTVEADVQLRPTATGVSEGDYGNQHVVYVADKAGADWLFDNTLQEYHDTLARYTRQHDISLVPRLSYLQTTLQATGENSGNSFLITSTADSDIVGPACSNGNGSTCTCGSGCLCISNDDGCVCSCGPRLPGQTGEAEEAQFGDEGGAGAGS